MHLISTTNLAPILVAVGAAVAIIAAGWATTKSFFSVYNAVRDTHKTVILLATNHLPHIQESLNKQDVAMNQIEQYGKDVNASVKTVEVRLNDHIARFEDTKKSVDRINDIFLVQAVDSIKRQNTQAVLVDARTERIAARVEDEQA